MRSSRPAVRARGIAATAGYPIIAVPFGMVPNAPQQPFPAGFNAKPAPFGVGFVGAQCSEPKLIEIAYAFEQATKKRVPPASDAANPSSLTSPSSASTASWRSRVSCER